MKRWFTLIEIVLVVLIIAIIVWTTSIRMDGFTTNRNIRQETITVYNKISNEWRDLLRWKWNNNLINITWNTTGIYINWKMLSWENIFFSWIDNTWFSLTEKNFQTWTIHIYKTKETWEIAQIEIIEAPMNEIKLIRTWEFSWYNK